jgi:hypothetical protein
LSSPSPRRLRLRHLTPALPLQHPLLDPTQSLAPRRRSHRSHCRRYCQSCGPSLRRRRWSRPGYPQQHAAGHGRITGFICCTSSCCGMWAEDPSAHLDRAFSTRCCSEAATPCDARAPAPGPPVQTRCSASDQAFLAVGARLRTHSCSLACWRRGLLPTPTRWPRRVREQGSPARHARPPPLMLR